MTSRELQKLEQQNTLRHDKISTPITHHLLPITHLLYSLYNQIINQLR